MRSLLAADFLGIASRGRQSLPARDACISCRLAPARTLRRPGRTRSDLDGLTLVPPIHGPADARGSRGARVSVASGNPHARLPTGRTTTQHRCNLQARRTLQLTRASTGRKVLRHHGSARRNAIVMLRHLFAVALMLFATSTHAGPTPAQKCAVAKNKAASKKTAAKLKCWQKAIATGQPAADSLCLSAAEGKFHSAITKAE